MSAALVMFMIPGLALFYGGMVRAKNVLATVMQSFFTLGLVSVLWVVAAYSLAFSPGNAFIGGLDWLGFAGVGQEPNPDLSATVPAIGYAVFQLFFAAITPALITGAFAERMKFSAFALFTTLWLFLVYAPLAHWVWAPGGWLRELGALDFAGGTVVHMNSGFAALAAAIVIGKRRGFLKEAIVPHNLTLTILGAGILWFGWFGFNAGSALAANGLAAQAFIATNTATGAAVLGWCLTDWLRRRKTTTLGAASGADGLLAGGGLTLLGKQAVAVVATLAFSFILSFGILKVVDLVVGLRVTEEEELSGLDISQHEEVGYAFAEGVGAAAPIPTGAAAPPERAPATVRVPQGDLG